MTVKPRNPGATMKEVALAAGVSVSAVSKVLHGKGKSIRVSEAKASHIREVAERMKYHPNALARSLRLARTHTVGLIFENFGEISAGPLFYVHLLDGVAGELFRNHYRLAILPEVPRDSAANALNDGRLDGVIWCKMPSDPALHAELANRFVPVVALNAPPIEESPIPCFVSCDNEAGAELVVDHLFGLGHRRILFVLEEGEVDTPDAQSRLRGFRKAMADRGLSATDEDMVLWSTSATELGRWWESGPPHTAIFAWNERQGGEILARARETGLRLPEELSVVGFDSTIYCDSTVPKLPAARQPIKEMAQTAARILL
ncbi:MAG TPA: LacI family DNA-binding transcriptional regulator, partial [Fimbriimonadaceae bacterium]|nr:LacI family DNA-binding transcriptional regulator [Fimbriimonadaceae bacterium]